MHTLTTTAKQNPSDEVKELGQLLSESFRSLLDGLPGGSKRPIDLARYLGVNTVSVGRLLRAVRSSDPLTCMHMVPGPEGLVQILRAAEGKAAPAHLMVDAWAAVHRFESFIEENAGSRATIDAVIGDALPEVREKIDVLHRQGAFKAFSHIHGRAAEISLLSQIMVPSSQPDRIDLIILRAHLGWWKTRPGTKLFFSTRSRLKDEPIPPSTLLPEFSSVPADQLRLIDTGSVKFWEIVDDRYGVASAVNAVTLDRIDGVELRPAPNM